MKKLLLSSILISTCIITASAAANTSVKLKVPEKVTSTATVEQGQSNTTLRASTTTTATDTDQDLPSHLDRATSTKICEDVKTKIDAKVAALNEFTENEKDKVGNVIEKLDKIKLIADDKLKDEDLVAEVQDRQDTVSDMLDKFVAVEINYVTKISDIKKVNCSTNLKDAKKKIEDSRVDHKSLVASNDDLHNYISKDVKQTIDKVKDSVDKNKGILGIIKSFISGN